MKTETVRFRGLEGRWYLVDEYRDEFDTYYLWESEQHGDCVPAILTDERLLVIDYNCESGLRVALSDNGIL